MDSPFSFSFSFSSPQHSSLKRKRLSDTTSEEEQQEQERKRKTNARTEILIIEDDDEPVTTRGAGTCEDPICFSDWITGNVIADEDHGAVFEVDEDGCEERYTAGDDAHQGGDSRDNTEEPYVHPLVRQSPVDLLSPPLQEECRNRSAEVDEVEEVVDDGDIIILHSDEDGEEYSYTQDWDAIKQEEDDENELIPALTFSQESETPQLPPTPSSTQDECHFPVNVNTSLRGDNIQLDAFRPALERDLQARNPGNKEQESPVYDQGPILPNDAAAELDRAAREKKMALIKLKKTLFYELYADRIIPNLRTKLARYRPETTTEDQCWLYPGPIRIGQGTIEITVDFRHNGARYKYYINLGFVALLVDGLLTKEYIRGIVDHQWHASHLCGNFTCTNPAHIVAEPGSVNSKRNSCLHGYSAVCTHTPPCLTHLKIHDL
jgi:hypothetical protein